MTAVEQILKAVASLHDPHHQSLTNTVEMEVEHGTTVTASEFAPPSCHPLPIDLPAIVNKQNTEIATINNKT